MSNQEIKNSKSIEIIINSILDIDFPTWEHFAKEKPSFQIPQNANTGGFYSGSNHLILMFNTMQKGFTSPFYLPVTKAINLKADFKGQKTTEILKYAPIYKHKETKKTITEAKFKLLSEELQKQYSKEAFFKFYKVLNLDQLNNYDDLDKSSLNLTAPSFEQNFELNEKAENFINKVIENKGLKLEKKRSLRAYYSPSADLVSLPKTEIFKDDKSLYSTTFHEIIHWTGHKERLNRFDKSFTNDQSKEQKYAFEELVAEMGALLLCNEFGIFETFNNSCQYLAGWLMNLRDNYNDTDLEKENVKEQAKEILSKAFFLANQSKDFLMKN